jgi:hypothetical protein
VHLVFDDHNSAVAGLINDNLSAAGKGRLA